jgi:hypothetical protein
MTTPGTYFYQGCPVCGRSLRIPVQHFGRRMSCSHCQGQFQTGEPAASAAEAPPQTGGIECRPHLSITSQVEQV